MPLTKLESWGGLHCTQETINSSWRHENSLPKKGASLLPYGLGRSYGDSCLNHGGTALLSQHLDHMISFDISNAELHCEAGVTLKSVLEWALPQGFFLPVSPGTQFVTVAGAIANDVHGKNHHVDGSFGAHVQEITIQRSDGSQLCCSRTQNSGLFYASIGGLGLTGFIVSAKFRLKKVSNAWIDQQQIKFSTLKEYFSLSEESKAFTYVVSWIDCLSATKPGKLKGIFIRGKHSTQKTTLLTAAGPKVSVPCMFPSWILNRYSIQAFNTLYYAKNFRAQKNSTAHYASFFYPLDTIAHWNRIYGRAGLLQYQCVIPLAVAKDSIQEILLRIARSGQGSFLGVLKNFGKHSAAGLLSFSREGVTLALDFKNCGTSTSKLFQDLDTLVLAAGGALYPAKDQRMGPEIFKRSFPKLQEFVSFKDPAFSSSFWRRVCPNER